MEINLKQTWNKLEINFMPILLLLFDTNDWRFVRANRKPLK